MAHHDSSSIHGSCNFLNRGGGCPFWIRDSVPSAGMATSTSWFTPQTREIGRPDSETGTRQRRLLRSSRPTRDPAAHQLADDTSNAPAESTPRLHNSESTSSRRSSSCCTRRENNARPNPPITFDDTYSLDTLSITAPPPHCRDQ